MVEKIDENVLQKDREGFAEVIIINPSLLFIEFVMNGSKVPISLFLRDLYVSVVMFLPRRQGEKIQS